jgi:hypothetical protein
VSDRTLGELPGLLAWGDELYAATAQAERPSRRGPRRLVRRAGVAVAVALLAVPAAVATRHGSHARAHRTGFGTAEPVRLSGYDAGRGRICTRPATFRGARPGACSASRSSSEP